MATDPSQIIAGLLQGGGFGRTINDNAQQNMQLQQGQQQVQAGQMQLQAAQQQQARAASYQQDVASYLANPKPETLGGLIAKYPEQAQQLKDSKSALDEPARQSQLTQYGQIFSAASAGRHDLLVSQAQQIKRAEAEKGIDTAEIDDWLGQLQSDDPATRDAAAKQGQALAMAHIAALDPKYGEALSKVSNANPDDLVVIGNHLVSKTTHQSVYDAPEKAAPAEYRTIKNADGSESIVQVGGGGQTSGGGAANGSAAPAGRDVSRLINTDAGGGYVPDSVKTLGQFVSFGRSLNNRGAKSSSAGTYQINGTTMAEFAPKALGTDWRNQPFDADSQEKVGKAIFDWAKQQRDPAAALKGRWVSLSTDAARQLVRGDWEQARGTIAQGETGGGAGASANSPSGSGRVVYSSAPATGMGDPTLTGEPYLASLPAEMRAKVKAVAEGRTQAPRPGTRFGEALLTAVTQYDPTFDAANAATRVKTRSDFTSGKSAVAVNALNTTMGHLLHLDDQVADLHNVGLFGGILNPLRRAIQTNVVGSKAYTNFDQTKQAASSEMRKVFAGSGGGNLTELKEWQESLDSARSPEQLHAAIQNGVELMSSRLEALRDQYTNGMGRSDNVPSFIKPSLAASARRRFGVDLGAMSAPPAPSGFKILRVRPK